MFVSIYTSSSKAEDDTGCFCFAVHWFTKESRRDPEVSAGEEAAEQELRAQEKQEKSEKEGQQPYLSPSMRLPYWKQMSLARTHTCRSSAFSSLKAFERKSIYFTRRPTVYRFVCSL
jgi:hypothetical protein